MQALSEFAVWESAVDQQKGTFYVHSLTRRGRCEFLLLGSGRVLSGKTFGREAWKGERGYSEHFFSEDHEVLVAQPSLGSSNNTTVVDVAVSF